MSISRFLAFVYLFTTLTHIGAQPVPSITRVSGCVDSGSVTLQCTLPLQLTLYGTNFLSLVPNANKRYIQTYLRAVLTRSQLASESGWSDVWMVVSANSAVNDTMMVVAMANPGYGYFDFDTLLSISVVHVDSNSGGLTIVNGSAPFPGVSINAYPRPQIYSISGCPVSENSMTVSKCIPGRDLLTLTGVSFSRLSTTSSYVSIRIGDNMLPFSSMMVSGNDSTIILSFVGLNSRSFIAMMTEKDFGGPIHELAIREMLSGLETECVHIQFDDLPAISVTDVQPYSENNNPSLSCKWSDKIRPLLTNCTSGVSVLKFTGLYFFNMSVAVGNEQLISVGEVTPLEAYFRFPVHSYQPNVDYDLLISSSIGATTMSSFVRFKSDPSVAFADNCVNAAKVMNGAASYSYASWLQCYFGQTLRLTGAMFPPVGTPVSLTIRSTSFNASTLCEHTRYESATRIACDLPALQGDRASNAADELELRWENGQSLVTSAFQVYDYQQSARITSVTGCAAQDECHGGELITMTGQRFTQYNYSCYYVITDRSNNLWTRYCPAVNVVNETVLVVQLPFVENDLKLEYGSSASFYLQARDGPRSSYLNVLFTMDLTDSSPDVGSGGHDTTTVTVIAVVLSIGCCLLITVILAYRYQTKRNARTSSFNSEDSDAQNVEVY